MRTTTAVPSIGLGAVPSIGLGAVPSIGLGTAVTPTVTSRRAAERPGAFRPTTSNDGCHGDAVATPRSERR